MNQLKNIFLISISILFLFTSCGNSVDWNEEKQNFKVNNENNSIILSYNGVPYNGKLTNTNDLSEFFIFEKNGIKSIILSKKKTAYFKNGKLDGYYELIDSNNNVVYDLKLSEGEEIKKKKYSLTKEEIDVLIKFLNGSWYFDRPADTSWGVGENSYNLGVEFETTNGTLKYYVNDYSVTDINPDAYTVSRNVDRLLGEVNFDIDVDEGDFEILLRNSSNTSNSYVFSLIFPEEIKTLNDKLNYLNKSIKKEKEILSKEGEKWNTQGDIQGIFTVQTLTQYWTYDYQLEKKITVEYPYGFIPVRLGYYSEKTRTLEGNKTFRPGETKF